MLTSGFYITVAVVSILGGLLAWGLIKFSRFMVKNRKEEEMTDESINSLINLFLFTVGLAVVVGAVLLINVISVQALVVGILIFMVLRKVG